MDPDGGDRAGLERFCHSQYPKLVGLLSLYCGDTATAEDLAQETLARVWRRWEVVRALDAPELWARRVALNLAASWFRRGRAASRAFSRVASLVDSQAPDPTNVDDEFRHIIANLSRRQRTVLLLRFHEDLSVADTARLMRVREGTVKALTAQALDALRRRGVSTDVTTDD
jgi:RNA polymerase sigma factor (sigma-70 family)